MADSETQRADMKKLIAEGNALIANCRQKRAERKAEAHKKLLAEAEAHKKLLAEVEAHKKLLAEAEAHKKLLAEAKALIAKCRLKTAEAEALIANSQLKRAEREAHENALAKAEPLLTTSQWLSAILIAASLAVF